MCYIISNAFIKIDLMQIKGRKIMRIGLKDVLDIVSTKTGIDKNHITFKASFDAAEIDVGKNCDKWIAKRVCVEEYNKHKSQGFEVGGLQVSIFAKGYKVLSFSAKDINPDTHDIYELMGVNCTCSCVGPGFYSYSPYLILDGDCDKKDIKKFIETISFDPNKTKVDFYPKSSHYNDSLNKQHRAFLRTLPSNALSKSFFKDIECAKSIETNTVKKNVPELTL